MFLTRQNMTGFTRASRPPSTDVCRSARCRSAHQVTLAWHDSRHRRPRHLCGLHTSFSLATAASAATAATAATATMASPTVLTFDAEGRAVDFDVWLRATPPLPLLPSATSCCHTFSLTLPPLPQLLTSLLTSTLVTPATALPFPLSSVARTPPMYITLYYLVTRLPDSHSSVTDHFLSLCPTELTLDLLEERLAAAEKSILAVGASRGDRRTPFFEGCSTVPLLPSVASAAAVDLVGTEEAAAAVAEVAVAVVLLREWYAGRGRSGGAGPCTYVLRTGSRHGETCGLPHTTERCFGRLTDAWRAQFPDAVELPSWADLLRKNVAIFDLDFDAILAAMYALTDSAEGDCYLSLPPDPSIEAAALGASASAAPGAGESALSGTAPTEALHTFTLDSGASRSFFRDSTMLTPLSRPVAVSLADPSGGPVLMHTSTVLPCPAAPSGLLSGLHLPLFSTNLVSGADLQDAWVDQFAPGGQRVTHCTCSRTGRHLATFTHRPGSSLYILTTAPPLVSASGQVAASSQVFAAASRSSMASRTLVSGLPQCLPPLPPGPAPTCVPCVKGRQRTAPHSSSFPPTEAPLQTLHMDVWGPARVRGQGHERYFLLVVDDYLRYTSVFPLHSKDRGGEFSSDLLRAFCRAKGIRQTFTLPDSPHKNGIAERRIGMVMDVARTSMIHAVAPHFLWTFAVQYAAHQLNLQPRVSLPETTPTLRWTGKVGDASAFPVLGSRAFVRDTSADKLSSHAVPCVYLGFPLDAHGWKFYHPTSRHVLSSQDVTFDESVSYYRTPPVDPLPPQGPALSGVSQVDPAEPVEVAVDSGAARGAEPAGAGNGVAQPERVEPGGAELERVESGGADPGGAEPGGAASWGAASWGVEPACAESGGSPGVPLRREPLSPQRLREWYARRCRRATSASGAGAVGGAAATGGAGGAAGADTTGGAAGAGAPGAAGPGGARTGGTGVAGAGGAAGIGAVGTGASGAGAAGGASATGGAGGAAGAETAGAVSRDPGAQGTGAVSTVSGGAAQPRPYFVPLLQQFIPASPLPGPSPYSGPTRGLTERREPESRPASPESRSASPVRTVRTSRRVSRPRPPPVPGTHSMTLRPSTAPQRVPLPSPPASSLPTGPDPESDSLRAASPSVSRFLATTSASASVCPPSIGGECALDTDVLEDRQEEFECFATAAIEGPYSSQWQAAMDAKMASWKSTGTYVDEVPPPGANIVSGMWIFRVKRPPISLPVFKARYVTRGFSQRQGVDFFQTFSPTPKMTTLRVQLHVAAQHDYELHSLDFSTTFLQGSLHEEICYSFTGSYPAGTLWSLRRPIYGLRQAPREWHDTLRKTLAALGFAPSTDDPSLFLRTDTTLPPFYVLVYVLQRFGFTYSSPQSTRLPTGHSLSAPPLDESVEPSGPYPELVGCLITSGMGLVLGGRARVVLTGHADASWVDDLATQRLSQGYTFSLGSGSVSWQSTRSTSIFSSSYEAEIYAGAMVAQELRWLTYLLTDFGEAPRSPPVLYVDNKAMLALCQEHRLEHRTKHFALHYFLARELQQCGQLRLAYMASQANNADVFTKALLP
ncbi:unnamed protein product, partial [Closterium sp. NIES-53]